MKEALYQKSGDPDVSLTGSANLGVHITLIVLGPLEWEDRLTTWIPTAYWKVYSFLRLLDVNIMLEIKDKMNLSNINGSKQKLLTLEKAAWLGEWSFVIKLLRIPILAPTYC